MLSRADVQTTWRVRYGQIAYFVDSPDAVSDVFHKVRAMGFPTIEIMEINKVLGFTLLDTPVLFDLGGDLTPWELSQSDN